MTRVRFFILISVVLLAGCGYQFVGSGSTLPAGISKIKIAQFVNQTKEPYLDTFLTESISFRLMRQHDIELVEADELADAVLSGFISEYKVAASAYDAQDAIQSYRLFMRVTASLQRVSDGKILWQGEAVRYQDFISSGADLTTQEGLEMAAQQQITDRLAEDLSWQMATEFGAD